MHSPPSANNRGQPHQQTNDPHQLNTLLSILAFWELGLVTISSRGTSHRQPLSYPTHDGMSRLLSCFSFLREGKANSLEQVRHPSYGPYPPYRG